jgi:DNA-binding transcriptional LysR family regulator
MLWIGPAEAAVDWSLGGGEPMPLASLEAPCLLRSAATKALDAAGIPWRLAFVSPSLGGLWAATAAGLGITIRTPIGLPRKVKPLVADAAGLPELSSLGLVLHRAEAEPGPATARLASIMLQSVREAVADVVPQAVRPAARAYA